MLAEAQAEEPEWPPLPHGRKSRGTFPRPSQLALPRVLGSKLCMC